MEKMPDQSIQTRATGGELRYYATLTMALIDAQKNKEVWKISFNTATGERVRLVRTEDGWVYESIEENRYI